MALDALTSKKAHKLFSESGILSDKELEARHEIYLEKYIKKVEIEANLLHELCMNMVMPACLQYQTDLLNNIKTALEAGIAKTALKTQYDLVGTIGKHIDGIYKGIDKMLSESEKAHHQKTTRDAAIYFCDKVKPLFLEIRQHSDALELYVEDKYWPLPKYREILFNR